MTYALKNALARGLTRLETLSGSQTFTWHGAEVPCVPSSLARGITIEIGGNPIEISLTLFVRRSNFLTADSTLITMDTDIYTSDSDLPTPLAGMSLVFRGKSYLIL